jgi:hypothetical protein
MCLTRYTRAGIGLAVLVLAAGCTRTETLTPEAARAKGDELLKQMSHTLATTQVFAYQSEQAIERIRGGGERVTDRFSRNTTVHRPNRLAFTEKGQDHDGLIWYDGKQLTIVSNRDKVWVRGPMPGTLDEAMDYVSAEYAVQIPTADLLYSNPYEALMTADTTGGWVNVEKVGERSCDHLSYQQPVVDWEIWLMQDDRRLPCQLLITYKSEPGKPTARIVFHDWNPAPTVSEATFTPVVPETYRRIKIMRHATVEDKSVAKEPGGNND